MLAFPDDGQIRFRKLRDAGSVLNATLVFVRRNARELLTSYLALVAPVALASGLALALWFRQFGDLMADPDALLTGDIQMFGWSYAGAVLFGLLGTALSQAAGAGYVRLYRQGEAGAITVGRLWDESRDLLLPFLALPFIFGVVMTLAAVLVIIPCLGALAWVGFVIWLLPYYAVTMAARALDEDSLGAAWTRARGLVKGSWGFAAGSLLLTFLILVLVYLALSVVLGAVMGIGMAGAVADDPAQAMGWMGVIYAPLQVVGYALYALIMVTVFFVHGRLAEELDGTTLHEDLDELAGAGFDLPAPPRTTTPEPPPSSTPPASGPPTGDAPGSEDTGGFRGGGFGG